MSTNCVIISIIVIIILLVRSFIILKNLNLDTLHLIRINQIRINIKIRIRNRMMYDLCLQRKNIYLISSKLSEQLKEDLTSRNIIFHIKFLLESIDVTWNRNVYLSF